MVGHVNTYPLLADCSNYNQSWIATLCTTIKQRRNDWLACTLEYNVKCSPSCVIVADSHFIKQLASQPNPSTNLEWLVDPNHNTDLYSNWVFDLRRKKKKNSIFITRICSRYLLQRLLCVLVIKMALQVELVLLCIRKKLSKQKTTI